MPEFHFFHNEQDEFEIITYIIDELKLWMVPDDYYDDLELAVIEDVELYKSRPYFKEGAGTFYILGDNYYKTSLVMDRFDEGELKGKYFLIPRNGGPAIDIHFRRVYEEDHKRFVAPAFVSHYPTFWHPEEEVNKKVPEEIKSTYKEIVKFIKKNGYPCEPVTNWRFYAGKHAVEEFMKGLLTFEWDEDYYTPVLSKKKERKSFS